MKNERNRSIAVYEKRTEPYDAAFDVDLQVADLDEYDCAGQIRGRLKEVCTADRRMEHGIVEIDDYWQTLGLDPRNGKLSEASLLSAGEALREIRTRFWGSVYGNSRSEPATTGSAGQAAPPASARRTAGLLENLADAQEAFEELKNTDYTKLRVDIQRVTGVTGSLGTIEFSDDAGDTLRALAALFFQARQKELVRWIGDYIDRLEGQLKNDVAQMHENPELLRSARDPGTGPQGRAKQSPGTGPC